jgi:cell division protein FtsW
MTAAAAAVATRRRARAPAGVRRERHQPAYGLLLAAVALVAFGVVMVYSASSVHSYLGTSDPGAQGMQQLIWAGLGLAAMLVASRIDFRVLRYLAIPGYWVSLVLLALVLVPSIGTEVAGSRRWIVLPGIGGFQPAELAKLAIVLYLAHWLDRRGDAARGLWNGFIPFLLIASPGFLLIAAEPDLGTSAVYVIAAGSVFFMAGANLVYLTAAIGMVLAAAVSMISRTPYQLERVQGFVDPFRDPLGSGYNTIQALLALALGGLTGAGLGESRQKYLYLPAPSTDFIFAIIGEEWGLVGTLGALLLFAVLAYQGYRIAVRAPDSFSGLLACGITTWLVAQAFINMAVVAALLPVTGIPLPFLSYGGSALTINLVAVGILLSISRETTEGGSIFDAIGDIRRRDRRARVPRAGRSAGAPKRAKRR